MVRVVQPATGLAASAAGNRKAVQANGMRSGFLLRKRASSGKSEELSAKPDPATARKDNATDADLQGPDDLIGELLNRPTLEFTEWALDQAKAVVGNNDGADVEVEKLDVWRYAKAFSNASSEQQSALMTKGMDGFKQLPAQRKGEVFAFYLKHGDLMKVLLEAVKQRLDLANAKELETSQASEPETNDVDDFEKGETSAPPVAAQGDSVEECAAVVASDTGEPISSVSVEAAEDLDPPAPQNEDDAESNSSEQGQGLQPGFLGLQPGFLKESGAHNCRERVASGKDTATSSRLENLQRIAAEAGLDGSTEAVTKCGAAAVAWLEAAPLVEPRAVLDAVSTLDAAERGQLADVLVDSGVVPEESQEVLYDAVRPGGYVDKLSLGIRVASAVWQHLWISYIIFFIEACFLSVIGWHSCSVPIHRWLRVDACLSACAVWSCFAIGRTLAPAIKAWQQDAFSTARTLREAILETPSWEKRLTAAFPDVPYSVFQSSLRWLAVLVLFFALDAMWLPVGLYQWIRGYFSVCERTVLWFSLLFLVPRCGIVLAFLSLYLYLRWNRRPLCAGEERRSKED